MSMHHGSSVVGLNVIEPQDIRDRTTSIFGTKNKTLVFARKQGVSDFHYDIAFNTTQSIVGFWGHLLMQRRRNANILSIAVARSSALVPTRDKMSHRICSVVNEAYVFSCVLSE